MDGTQIVVALIAGVTGGGTLIKLAEGVVNHFSGRFEQERTRNSDILTMRDKALEEAHRAETERRLQERTHREERERIEDEHRIEVRRLEAELRVISYHAQLLTRMLIEAGFPADRVPNWPIPPR